jgi:hypothetical protein
MIASGDKFDEAIRRQIAVNQTRTPDERFAALCDLLDVAREMAPRDAAARDRRLRALESRARDREKWRAICRQFHTAQRTIAYTPGRVGDYGPKNVICLTILSMKPQR